LRKNDGSPRNKLHDWRECIEKLLIADPHRGEQAQADLASIRALGRMVDTRNPADQLGPV